MITVGICYVHRDWLGADKRVLSTTAHGRVEGTGCHGGVGLGGGRLCKGGFGEIEWLGGYVEMDLRREIVVVEADITVAIGDLDSKGGLAGDIFGKRKEGLRRRRDGGGIATDRAGGGRVVGF